MKNALLRFFMDERGQVLVERAIIAAFFTIAVLAGARYVVDGLVNYYATVTGVVCLPVP